MAEPHFLDPYLNSLLAVALFPIGAGALAAALTAFACDILDSCGPYAEPFLITMAVLLATSFLLLGLWLDRRVKGGKDK